MDFFEPSDIKWVRNVKRSKGTDWAYEDVNDIFQLHWSSSYKDGKEAAKPKPGELILLIQRPHQIIPGTFVTHLVTPVDNIVSDEIETSPDHRWSRNVMVVAKANKLNEIIKPKNLNFRKVSRTHSFKIEHITINNETNKQLVQNMLWNVFLPHFKQRSETDFLNLNLEPQSDELALVEGKEREVLKKHLLRERKSELVIQKKNVSPDLLNCECCHFNFLEHYGNHGAGYIECHHRIPINLGERITKLSDLALVCSNCHRMLHRKNENGKYFTVEELKKINQK